MERGWTGKLERTDCGLASFDFCDLNREEEELVVKLDIRQCRVRQFRSVWDLPCIVGWAVYSVIDSVSKAWVF